ncbi:bifunctional hydroxymethylpyrimidine kinase/phosphomethylpyrimidine kinase [Halomonas halocynthiae]|uniref:bifunctional hydroxymethylpyrimidine kinase/phosphomethylpyrimidine kinase n=1 Tax=Halomonas halocynthiae TaxID=176290 RepID=UPI001F0A11B5|nr:hydroxymethylpyrimidine/phosphomethylpyrimidine kinase [Halomonas halocynthiae]
MSADVPIVLVFSGHDPTGGAGLVADSEAIAACGGWAMTIPTALTVQNCRNVQAVAPVSGSQIRAMANALEDLPVAAIKVGLIASIDSLLAVMEIIRQRPGVPVIVDPVLKASGGAELSDAELVDTFCELLLPQVDIVTPNRYELARLAGPDSTDDTQRATALLHRGCQAVLVTGTDDPVPGVAVSHVMHTLHRPHGDRQWQWPRLAGSYHGSGCTLAAALAARLAIGEGVVSACEQAQAFTWQALKRGWQPGKDQYLPRRLWQLPNTSFTIPFTAV